METDIPGELCFLGAFARQASLLGLASITFSLATGCGEGGHGPSNFGNKKNKCVFNKRTINKGLHQLFMTVFLNLLRSKSNVCLEVRGP